MRDRLIELIESRTCRNNFCQSSCVNCENVPLQDEEVERLADYLLENGVIVLPQTVYWYDMGGNLKEATVKNKFFAELKNGFEYDISYDEIGKTVFLTKNQAQEALKNEQEKL
jgi:hypothetical protein